MSMCKIKFLFPAGINIDFLRVATCVDVRITLALRDTHDLTSQMLMCSSDYFTIHGYMCIHCTSNGTVIVHNYRETQQLVHMNYESMYIITWYGLFIHLPLTIKRTYIFMSGHTSSMDKSHFPQ
jgi:hypothetical protein